MKYLIIVVCLIVCYSCSSKKAIPNVNIEKTTSANSKTIFDFGVVGDGVTDDSKALQRIIDSGINPLVFPHGKYKITQPLELPNRYKIIGNKSYIYYVGNKTAFKAKDNIIAGDCEISDLYIEVKGRGAKAITISNFQYSHFTGLALRLKGKNTIGLYLKGNGKGTGPYYNSFNNIFIIGDNNALSSPDQVGIKLDDSGAGHISASGPNANNFSNIKRIAGVSIAIDIIAGTGNLFENIQTESIQNYHYRLNYRPSDFHGKVKKMHSPNTILLGQDHKKRIHGDIVVKLADGSISANRIVGVHNDKIIIDNSISKKIDSRDTYEIYKTKAEGNKFINLRAEGTGKSCAIQLCHGAINNSFKDYEFGSINPIKIIRQTNTLSNTIGDLMPLVFTVENVQPNTKTQLIPFKGPYGGIPISINCRLDGIHIKSINAATGLCKVNAMRNSGKIELNPRLNKKNPFSNYKFLEVFDSGSYARLRPGDGLQVELETDSNWTPNDVIITIWIAK